MGTIQTVGFLFLTSKLSIIFIYTLDAPLNCSGIQNSNLALNFFEDILIIIFSVASLASFENMIFFFSVVRLLRNDGHDDEYCIVSHEWETRSRRSHRYKVKLCLCIIIIHYVNIFSTTRNALLSWWAHILSQSFYIHVCSWKFMQANMELQLGPR